MYTQSREMVTIQNALTINAHAILWMVLNVQADTNIVRVWIISHGTPHAATNFQRTPSKIFGLFSSSLARKVP